MAFKVGDKVRRKPEYQNSSGWPFGDKSIEIAGINRYGDLTFEGNFTEWNLKRFELVELTLDERIEKARAKLADLERQKLDAIAPKPGETWIAKHDKTVTVVILEIFQDFVIYRAMHNGTFQFASSSTLKPFLERYYRE